MRFPSLFRVPRHQQFDIKPRYYDPVKEFIDERKAIANRKEDDDTIHSYSASRIRFERRKTSGGMSTSLMQLIIALFLSTLVVGWLYLGNDILYLTLILVPVYFYFRFKKK